MKAQYVTAVLELLGSDASVSQTEEVINKLKTVLQSRGHERLLSGILRGVVKRLAHRAPSEVIVTLAEASDAEYKKYKEHIAASGLQHDESDVTLQADPTIIGGFTLTVADRMIDNSYKSRLLTLYRSITT